MPQGQGRPVWHDLDRDRARLDGLDGPAAPAPPAKASPAPSAQPEVKNEKKVAEAEKKDSDGGCCRCRSGSCPPTCQTGRGDGPALYQPDVVLDRHPAPSGRRRPCEAAAAQPVLARIWTIPTAVHLCHV